MRQEIAERRAAILLVTTLVLALRVREKAKTTCLSKMVVLARCSPRARETFQLSPRPWHRPPRLRKFRFVVTEKKNLPYPLHHTELCLVHHFSFDLDSSVLYDATGLTSPDWIRFQSCGPDDDWNKYCKRVAGSLTFTIVKDGAFGWSDCVGIDDCVVACTPSCQCDIANLDDENATTLPCTVIEPTSSSVSLTGWYTGAVAMLSVVLVL